MIDMSDPAARREVYERLYAAGRVPSPDKKRGLMDPYGSHENRDREFLKFLGRKYKDGDQPRVLDASAGRGHLSVALAHRGYEVEATEYVQSAYDALPVPPLKAKHLLTYGELGQLPERSFDVVISNDVLEHLPADEAKPALAALARLSRLFLLVSVGVGFGALKYTTGLGMGKLDLHLHCPGAPWWRKALAEIGREVWWHEIPKKTLWCFLKVNK
jgi:SAM-dependent methyltransferase